MEALAHNPFLEVRTARLLCRADSNRSSIPDSLANFYSFD
jgi:hypothetical protein